MEGPYRAGIVGSRRRNTLHDRNIVLNLVGWLMQRAGDRGLVVVSGGATQGADAFAEEMAKIYQINMEIHRIDREGIDWNLGKPAYIAFTERAYARNRVIAERSEELFCLTHEDRTGGTENTISHMRDLKKPVFLVSGNGEIYLSPDGKMPTCAPVAHLLGSSSTA